MAVDFEHPTEADLAAYHALLELMREMNLGLTLWAHKEGIGTLSYPDEHLRLYIVEHHEDDKILRYHPEKDRKKSAGLAIR